MKTHRTMITQFSLPPGRIQTGLFLMLAFTGLAMLSPVAGQTEELISHSRVREEVDKTYENMQSMVANFTIQTNEGNRGRSMSGRVYFKKPDLVRYEFSNPAGNLIVSDGRIMWYYIRRLNVVGRQELDLDRRNASGNPVFSDDPVAGIRRLFVKYHFHFDTPEQPREIGGERFFVFDMEQREKIGGYEKIKLYIDADTYIVKKAEASDGYGKSTTISFSNVQLDGNLEGRLFQYQPDDRTRVVPNPFVKPDEE